MIAASSTCTVFQMDSDSVSTEQVPAMNSSIIMLVKKQSWSKGKLSNHANYEDRARGDLILGLLLGSKRRPASSNIN